MLTTTQTPTKKQIPSLTKCAIALEAMGSQSNITAISTKYDCCRNTVYEQKKIAVQATNKAFEEIDDDVLFTISVTKEFLYGVVVALFSICGCSHRGIQYFLMTIFNQPIGLGTVFNILDDAAVKAKALNDSYDLGVIKSSAADEVFHRNKPNLVVVDIPSRFCALLAKTEKRDKQTWRTHLALLQARNYLPVSCIIDEGKGMEAAYKENLSTTTLRYDHFHFIRDIKDVSRFLKNQIASKTTLALDTFCRAERAKDDQTREAYTTEFTTLLAELGLLEELYPQFQTLSQWLQYDVLQLAGHRPEDRARLYDFIVDEMRQLAGKHPHRIQAIVTSLCHRREALLNVANELNDKFAKLAQQHEVTSDTIWAVCYITRYDIDACTYHEKSSELEAMVGQKYESIEDDVLTILANTHRCSSMVENFNSRLRPYLDKRKFISQKMLDLIQFYLNHKPFMRSAHKDLVKKTPAQALTGKQHLPWLEMLGFHCFKRQTA
jgi:hypothetical protein